VVVDVAHKVVGVGSVGLRAFVVLLQGNSARDSLFLQLKQARRSCVATFVHGGTAWHTHQGQRVGVIRLAHIDVDYTRRLDPDDVITTLRELTAWTKLGR
jgi:uncharacterized protein (DUF2252 family)